MTAKNLVAYLAVPIVEKRALCGHLNVLSRPLLTHPERIEHAASDQVWALISEDISQVDTTPHLDKVFVGILAGTLRHRGTYTPDIGDKLTDCGTACANDAHFALDHGDSAGDKSTIYTCEKVLVYV